MWNDDSLDFQPIEKPDKHFGGAARSFLSHGHQREGLEVSQQRFACFFRDLLFIGPRVFPLS